MNQANNLRTTVYNPQIGVSSPMTQFEADRAQKKLRDDFFKQKCKTLIKKKMEFLITHNKKQKMRNKRVIRWNVSKKNTETIDDILGDTIFASNIKKPKKKKIIKRSTSSNAEYDKVKAYWKNIHNKNFTNIQIKDSSLSKRRVSYCQVATKEQPKERNLSKEIVTKEGKSGKYIQARKSSFTKTSIFENTETSTWDTGSTKVTVLNLKSEIDPLRIKRRISGGKDKTKGDFITPIKRKRSIMIKNCTSSKYMCTSPMIIQSVNTTTQSVYDSGRKPKEDPMPPQKRNIYAKRISLTWGKSKKKLKKDIKYKSKLKIKSEIQPGEEVKAKRLNIRNKELHIQAKPYTELKEYIGNHDQIKTKTNSRVKAKYIRSMTQDF